LKFFTRNVAAPLTVALAAVTMVCLLVTVAAYFRGGDIGPVVATSYSALTAVAMAYLSVVCARELRQ